MDEQLNLMDCKSVSPVVAVNPDALGCCSSYRECSSSHMCLRAGDPFYKDCIYRKNLEAGLTFYGKEADGFDMEVYTELCTKVNALPTESKSALYFVLLDFTVFNRWSVFTIARSAEASRLKDLDIFYIRPLGADFPRLCGFSELKKIVQKNEGYKTLYKEARDKRSAELKGKTKEERKEIPGPNTKEFFQDWLNGDAVSIRDALASPYCSVRVRLEAERYVEELFRDYIVPFYDAQIFPKNPLNEDGLRRLIDREKDEERRVKLSPGYTKEEKNRLTAPILAAREARKAARETKRKEQEANKA